MITFTFYETNVPEAGHSDYLVKDEGHQWQEEEWSKDDPLHDRPVVVDKRRFSF